MSAGTPTYNDDRPWEDGPDELEPNLELTFVPGSPPRLVVAGEVDLLTVARFEESIVQACRSGQNVVIDLTGLEFINSAGIGTLYRYSGQLAAVLVAESSLIYRALAYAGFTRLVPVIPSS